MKKNLFCRLISVALAVCTLLCVMAALPLSAFAADDASSTSAKPAYDYDENIIISVFYPPTLEYTTDEQYKLMAEAGIDWVLGTGDASINNPEAQKKMLELCEKYGMAMTVSDGNFGDKLQNKSDAQIAELINAYKDYPAAQGYYLRDEPFNPNEYVDTLLAMKKADPNAYVHLNFYPMVVYGSWDRYYSQMYDWCALVANGGATVDCLIFDNYPFPAGGTSMFQEGYLNHLRVCHDVGLAHNVRTGTYIQSVELTDNLRRPTDSELRYEMYVSLAFGMKQLSFFTWFTPTNNGGEQFVNGIIAADGTPNSHYETIKTLNKEIHAIGTILAKCDALEVYLSGNETWDQPSIPEDFFVHINQRALCTASFLRHKETGRNYLMVVNNKYSSKQNVTLTFDEEITSVSEVSRTDGSLVPMTMEGQTVSFMMEKGDAILIALPEGYDYYKPAGEPAPGTNLATLDGVTVTATTSLGESGYYINLLADGKRVSDSISKGWATTAGKEGQVTIDLGAVRAVNRVDLYPSGGLFDYGDNFPKNFDVLVSEDGKAYQTVASVRDFEVDDKGKTVTFDTVNAQYVRVVVPAGEQSVIAEIEIYNDNGSINEMPAYAELSNDVIDYTKDDNIALKRPVYTSSTTPTEYEASGWAPHFINDGNPQSGWTSNVQINTSPDSTEFAIIDLGDLFAVNKFALTAKGCFPIDYTIAVSADAKEWTTVYEVTNAQIPTQTLEIALDEAANARYVRLQGTKLRQSGTDGYLMQIGEFEIYGTPVCDKTALEAAMADYLTRGGVETDAVYAEAAAGVADDTLTQSQANALAKALNTAVITEPETEADTTADPLPETQAPVEETEAEAQSSAEATTDADASTDAATSETQASGGCGSVISISSGVLLAVMAGFILCKKKES